MQSGERLGPYELLSLAGAGGMGEVWKARDTRLDRVVAIKKSAERFNDRFQREARATAALNHPHICSLYDVGPDYLVMEYVEGKPLRGPLALATALEYGKQIADALHCAHAKGIVHRDLKPPNVLATKSGVKLLDFGLAKMGAPGAPADETVTLAQPVTKDNTILGTLQYMAPEQLEGKPADARSDIFAFGLVLYEILTGKPAFAGTSQASLIAAILKEEPAPLSAAQPLTPPALDRLVKKCLAKDPDGRWQSAADLRDELEWIAQTVPKAPAAPAVSRRGWMQWGLLAAGLALAALAGILWQATRTPAKGQWTGVRLGGPAIACGPRISPDGQLLAFTTMADGLMQLAVMKADGGSWTLLTNQRRLGYVAGFTWAPDGSKIYFDRTWDQPRGVWSIPALGGEPTLLLENACGPEALPDGSLIIAKRSLESTELQLFHFWPDSGRLEALPALVGQWSHPGVRAFPDGKEVVFLGRRPGEGSEPRERQLYALNLTTRRARVLGPALSLREQQPVLAATPDGKSVLTFADRGDMRDLVRVPRDGSAEYVVLLSLPATMKQYYLDAGRDGSVYLDNYVRPLSALRILATGGAPEETPLVSSNSLMMLLPLAGGRFLLNVTHAGREQALLAQPGGAARPFLQTTEDSTFPFAAAGDGRVIFRIGPEGQRRLAIASLRDGRILRRMKLPADGIESIAVSPEGKLLYYAVDGAAWSMPIEENERPKRLAEGTGVALDPAGRVLYIQQMNRVPAGLVRMPAAGGEAEEAPFPAGRSMTSNLLTATAVDVDERVVVETASADSFWFGPVILDPKRKTATAVKVDFEGDIWFPSWTEEGRILATGARFSSSIWRFTPPGAKR